MIESTHSAVCGVSVTAAPREAVRNVPTVNRTQVHELPWNWGIARGTGLGHIGLCQYIAARAASLRAICQECRTF